MATYSYRIEPDPATGRPIAWVDADGWPAIRQPHHPSALLDPADPLVGLWASEEEAAAWAEQYIADTVAAEEAAVALAAAQAQAADEDRARMVRIEEMLAELLAR